MDMYGPIDVIVSWLNTECQKAHKKGFVVGVSGGIDSAVTSTLAAMTGYLTYVVSMPIHQESGQKDRAQEHIKWLTDKYKNARGYFVDLTNTFEAISTDLPPGITDLAFANTRSRLRMCTLYAIATSLDTLVVGTGNKVEDFGVGFFTKYGDGGVDLSPLGDLTKTQVYQVAETLKIVESIRTAAPTDGLWEDNRTDEQQLGSTYAELERAMEICENEHWEKVSDLDGISDLLRPDVRDTVVNYLKKHEASQHKMNMPPICKLF